MFVKLKQRYKEWKDQRILKREGFSNWEQYHRWHDPFVNQHVDKMADYYHGYKHVIMIEDHKHFAYSMIYDYGPGGSRYGYNEIIDWCEENCTGKFRADFHRVFKQTGIGFNGATEEEWHRNEIGGGDYLFLAFMHDKDVTWFKLRWL